LIFGITALHVKSDLLFVEFLRIPNKGHFNVNTAFGGNASEIRIDPPHPSDAETCGIFLPFLGFFLGLSGFGILFGIFFAALSVVHIYALETLFVSFICDSDFVPGLLIIVVENRVVKLEIPVILYLENPGFLFIELKRSEINAVQRRNGVLAEHRVH